MISSVFNTAIENELPILFLYIGWAMRYDGTEPVIGGQKWLKGNPNTNWEREAFLNKGGYFSCRVGRGELSDGTKLHVVFVARDPREGDLKVIGVYASAAILPEEDSEEWPNARTRTAMLFSRGERPIIQAWPGKQGIRRWARHANSGGVEHAALLRLFNRLRADIVAGRRQPATDAVEEDQEEAIEAFEGAQRAAFRAHRKRESRLRRAKIRDTLKSNDGRLICEVPKCGFDFEERYGECGVGYAQVHHLLPLGSAPRKGQRTGLDQLAVVCANCHVMIHRGGECRPLETLIS